MAPKIKKIEILYEPVALLLGTHTKEIKSVPCSLQYYSQLPR
jgi:hypothetical protein